MVVSFRLSLCPYVLVCASYSSSQLVVCSKSVAVLIHPT